MLPLCTSLLFSGSFIAGKYTTIDLGPLTTSFLRYIVAMIFLFSLVRYYKWSSLRMRREDIILFILLGLFGIVGYHYFFFLSLHYTEVANTAIINALSPIVTGILAAIFIKERLFARNYLGIALAFVSVIILLMRGEIENLIKLNVNRGDFLMLLSVISWVVYALMVKKLVKKYDGFTVTFYATLFGVIMLFFFAMIEDFIEQLQQISIQSVLSVLYMGICASGAGYLFYNYSIKEIGPTRTSSFVYSCVPVGVAVLALIFFKQPITGVMMVSALLIIIGLNFMLMET